MDALNDKSRELDEMTIGEKIDYVIKSVGNQSSNSGANLPITKVIADLTILFNAFEDIKNEMSDAQSHQLYLQFHGFIKKAKQQQTQLGNESCNALLSKDEKKLKIIKEDVLKMILSAQEIYNKAFKETQKHILWMDRKKQNNAKDLLSIQENYKNQVVIKYYSEDEEFQKDVLNLKDFPLILIMSASAAGNSREYGDGNHLEYIQSIKSQLRLRGIIIFCGKNGEESMKQLQKNQDNMIFSVNTTRQLFLEAVERLVVPLDFKRVVPLRHLDYYLSKLIKEKVITWSLKDWSQVSLEGFREVNFETMFDTAKKLIIMKKINILKGIIDQMHKIPGELAKIFSENNTEQKLSFKLMRLYSNEQNPCYKLLNSVLNIMNDDLMYNLMDFIILFLVSLFKYNDSAITIIEKTQSGEVPRHEYYEFFRGTSIPINFVNNNGLVDQQYITLPSFSSFTTKVDKALNFMKNQQKFGDSTPLLLYYKYQTGTSFYNSRPKCIKEASCYPSEEEYLVYPFTSFFVKSLEKRQGPCGEYLFAELTVN